MAKLASSHSFRALPKAVSNLCCSPAVTAIPGVTRYKYDAVCSSIMGDQRLTSPNKTTERSLQLAKDEAHPNFIQLHAVDLGGQGMHWK
jgi:hypothetical protein